MLQQALEDFRPTLFDNRRNEHYRAHHDLKKASKPNLQPKPAESARNWIVSEDVGWPLSFENVCVELNLDADAIRTKLRAKGWI